jgi:5-bromo-4-chloroindolyl phosphate hydrolysis protein
VQDFENEIKDYRTLNLDELQKVYKELGIQYSILSTENRHLKREINEIRKWTNDEGLTTKAIKEIRSQVLSSYLSKLKPLQKSRGRPTSLQMKYFKADLLYCGPLSQDNLALSLS